MSNNAVYSNGNYKVEVGDGIDYEVPHYLIINKNTGVVETESRLLPQSVMYCDQLNESLISSLNPTSDGKVLGPQSVVSAQH